MLLSIDPVVCTVHAYDTKHSALHGRNVRVEQSVALKHRAAVSRDGEWVCAVVHVMCWPAVPLPLASVITQWHAQLVPH